MIMAKLFKHATPFSLLKYKWKIRLYLLYFWFLSKTVIQSLEIWPGFSELTVILKENI